MTTNNDNQRVTVAVLKAEISHLAVTQQTEMQHLSDKLDRYHDQTCKNQDDHEQRIRHLESGQTWNVWRDLGTLAAAIGAGIAGAFSGK